MSDSFNDTFPTNVDELTTEWVDAKLHAAGAISTGERVVGFDVEPLGEGFGMLGLLVRLVHTYRDGSGSVPTSIFKCATPSAANRAVAGAFDMYNREYSFYRHLATTVPDVYPHCYSVDYDPGQLHFAMLMEDLGAYRRGDQAAGCGVDDARICIDTMAALHASWWDRTDDARLAWVPRVNGEMYKVGMVAGVEAGWAPAMNTFGHLLPAELADAGPRYLAALTDLHDRMAAGHQTFLHGDFRLDNILFGDVKDHKPLVLVDWQGVIVSKGPQDLAYLLTQNVTIDIRRRHENELVHLYHDGLVAHGVTGYGFEECWDDYRLAALWLWEYAIVIAGTLDPANDRGVAFMAGLVERAAATITDLQLLELIA